MPLPLIIKLVEIIFPPLIQLAVNHYSQKKDPTPEDIQKLQAHQLALDAYRPQLGNK